MHMKPVLFELPVGWTCGICNDSTLSGVKATLVKLSTGTATCNHIFHKNCFDQDSTVPPETPRFYAKYCPTCYAGVGVEMIETIANPLFN